MFGHSLDVTVEDIINKMINNDYINTTIFYVNRGELERKVTNLVKVIGEDDLIARLLKNQITFEQLVMDKLP